VGEISSFLSLTVNISRTVADMAKVANIFVTLVNHTTKFKEFKIQEKVSPVLVSNGRREKRPEIRELP